MLYCRLPDIVKFFVCLDIWSRKLPDIPQFGPVSAKDLAKFEKNIKCESVVSASIVGGVVSQFVLKSVSANEAPMNNMFIFDGQGNWNGVILKL